MCESLPDFLDVASILDQYDADFSASEVHGMACAALVVNTEFDQHQWLQTIFKDLPTEGFALQAIELLQTLYRKTHEQLNSSAWNFTLFLPGDTFPLEERLTALQAWCSGYAYGLAIAGLSSLEVLADASKEWTEDVIKIAASGSFDLSDEEAAETAMMELEEFLKVGALMAFTERNAVDDDPIASPAVH